METFHRGGHLHPLCSLETFLGGMETGKFQFWKMFLYHLETFLGGMETIKRKEIYIMDNNLETFLGGMETLFFHS